MNLPEDQIKLLIKTAYKMMNFSYVPYSRFTVGAALLCDSDKIYSGCNIENAAFGPSICAERTALFKAISDGEKKFKAIAICGGPEKNTNDYCMPCGVCRQVMREFCDDDFLIICAKNTEEYQLFQLKELLPCSFKPEGIIGADSCKN